MESFYMGSGFFWKKQHFLTFLYHKKDLLKYLEIKILNAIFCDLCRDTTKNNPLDYYGIPLAMMLDFKCNEMKQWNEAAAPMLPSSIEVLF